jgi:hypothetical protein
VQLNAIGDTETMPAQRDVVVVSDGFIRSGAKRGRE